MDRPAQPVQLKLNLQLPLEESFDVFTAARVAKVSQKTMRRWCEENRVVAFKPVGRWRVDMQSLYSLIAASRNGAAQTPHHEQNPSSK
jgi:hypothetical protein